MKPFLNFVIAHSGACSCREAEDVSAADAYDSSCHRARPPKGREPIDWKLVTDLPIRSRKAAIEKLNWYAMRWKIETFHKILKSGCKAEDVKLRTAERLVNFIAILCLLSWRVFWITMLNRAQPEASPEMALTPTEIYLLDQLVSDSPSATPTGNQLSLYLTKLARLGGYLARAKGPPPGNTVMWRGMTRLTDIQLGFILGTQLVGMYGPPPCRKRKMKVRRLVCANVFDL